MCATSQSALLRTWSEQPLQKVSAEAIEQLLFAPIRSLQPIRSRCLRSVAVLLHKVVLHLVEVCKRNLPAILVVRDGKEDCEEEYCD